MKEYKKKVFERYYLKFRGQMLSLAQDFFLSEAILLIFENPI